MTYYPVFVQPATDPTNTGKVQCDPSGNGTYQCAFCKHAIKVWGDEKHEHDMACYFCNARVSVRGYFDNPFR